MQKTILLTGATDGIGLETLKMLLAKGHHVIAHGRNPDKLNSVIREVAGSDVSGKTDTLVADLSDLNAVREMVNEVRERFGKLDVLINNAGVYRTPEPLTKDDLDVRFVVNTLAPYYLAKELLPLMDADGRVINLSSAAQSSVSLDALQGKIRISDSEAYAQSKLALTIWSAELGKQLAPAGPMMVSVNPKSLLGSKMVKEAFGIAGGDLTLGADILVRAALSDEFSNAHGLYYDNDIEAFGTPHPEAQNKQKADALIAAIEAMVY